MEAGLAEIANLLRYRVEYRLTDLLHHRYALEGQLKVDQERAQMEADLRIYRYVEDDRETYRVRLASFQGGARVYFQAFRWYDSLGLWTDLLGSTGRQELLNSYGETWVRLPLLDTEDDQPLLESGPDLMRSLVLWPDLEVIETLASDTSPVGVFQLLSLERIEIPPNLFTDSMTGRFSLGSLVEQTTEAEQGGTQTLSRLHLDLAGQYRKDSRYFDLALRLDQAGGQNALATSVPSLVAKEDESIELNLSTRYVLDKLTRVMMAVDPVAQTYSLELTGLADLIEWNIFKADPADFKTIPYKLAIRISPLDQSLPHRAELSRMNLKQFNQTVNQCLSSEGQAISHVP